MGNQSYRVAEIGALVGDPARASILTELMSGRALTAGELAIVAHITPQTASSHLHKLEQAHLIRSERQGRHRYVAIASREVAHMLETMYSISAVHHKSLVTPPRVFGALKRARTCYDHLAGELGVALCDALTKRKLIVLHDEAAELTKRGVAFVAELGLAIDLDQTPRSRRPLCKTCLDWSERRYHLSGRFGAALADVFSKNAGSNGSPKAERSTSRRAAYAGFERRSTFTGRRKQLSQSAALRRDWQAAAARECLIYWVLRPQGSCSSG